MIRASRFVLALAMCLGLAVNQSARAHGGHGGGGGGGGHSFGGGGHSFGGGGHSFGGGSFGGGGHSFGGGSFGGGGHSFGGGSFGGSHSFGGGFEGGGMSHMYSSPHTESRGGGGGFFFGHHSHQAAEPLGQSFESRGAVEPVRVSPLEQSNTNFRSWIERSNSEHEGRGGMRVEPFRNEPRTAGAAAPGVSGSGASPVAAAGEMMAAPEHHHHFLWFGGGHSRQNTAITPVEHQVEPISSGNKNHLPWISDEAPRGLGTGISPAQELHAIVPPSDMHGIHPGIPPTDLHAIVPPMGMHPFAPLPGAGAPPVGLHAIVPPTPMDPYHYHLWLLHQQIGAAAPPPIAAAPPPLTVPPLILPASGAPYSPGFPGRPYWPGVAGVSYLPNYGYNNYGYNNYGYGNPGMMGVIDGLFMSMLLGGYGYNNYGYGGAPNYGMGAYGMPLPNAYGTPGSIALGTGTPPPVGAMGDPIMGMGGGYSGIGDAGYQDNGVIANAPIVNGTPPNPLGENDASPNWISESPTPPSFPMTANGDRLVRSDLSGNENSDENRQPVIGSLPQTAAPSQPWLSNTVQESPQSETATPPPAVKKQAPGMLHAKLPVGTSKLAPPPGVGQPSGVIWLQRNGGKQGVLSTIFAHQMSDYKPLTVLGTAFMQQHQSELVAKMGPPLNSLPKSSGKALSTAHNHAQTTGVPANQNHKKPGKISHS